MLKGEYTHCVIGRNKVKWSFILVTHVIKDGSQDIS